MTLHWKDDYCVEHPGWMIQTETIRGEGTWKILEGAPSFPYPYIETAFCGRGAASKAKAAAERIHERLTSTGLDSRDLPE